MISGILLAAGNSTRMGKDNKLLLPYKGRPLFMRSLNAMLDSNLDEIIVVLGHDFKNMMPFLNNSCIKVGINGNYLQGQTTSIQAGLNLINPTSKAYLICLADMPLINSLHINTLLDIYEDSNDKELILRPGHNGIPGNPCLFSKCYYEELLNCESNNGCRTVIKKNVKNLRIFETSDNAYFTDVDTPSEYLQFNSKV